MAGKAMKLEACFERLEQILSLMEQGDIPLDEAVALYEEGRILIDKCNSTLTGMKNKVMILQKENGKIKEVPMETGGAIDDDLEPV